MTDHSNYREPGLLSPAVIEKCNRLDRQASVVKNGHPERFTHYEKVRKLFGEQLPSAEQLTTLANQLYQDYIHGMDPTSSLLSYFIVIEMIESVFDHAYGKTESETNDHILELLEEALLTRIALGVFRHYSSDDEEALSMIENIAKEENSDASIVFVRERFIRRMTDFRNAHQFSKMMHDLISHEIPDIGEHEREMKRMNDEMFREMKRLQRYTLQEVNFDDPLLDQGVFWGLATSKSFNEYLPQQESHIENESLRMRAAGMAIFTPFFTARKDTGDHEAVNAFFGSQGMEFAINPSDPSCVALTYDGLNFVVDKDSGELFHKMYPLRIPLKAFFQRCGASGEYEYLRCALLSTLYDNIVPITLLQQSQTLWDVCGQLRSLRSSNPSACFKVLRDFIAPRIIRLKKAKDEDIRGDLLHELEELVGKKIQHQFFGRVGHPMKLRAGYRPHTDARKWAKEDGLDRELEEDETWCRPIESPVPVVHWQKNRKN